MFCVRPPPSHLCTFVIAHTHTHRKYHFELASVDWIFLLPPFASAVIIFFFCSFSSAYFQFHKVHFVSCLMSSAAATATCSARSSRILVLKHNFIVFRGIGFCGWPINWIDIHSTLNLFFFIINYFWWRCQRLSHLRMFCDALAVNSLRITITTTTKSYEIFVTKKNEKIAASKLNLKNRFFSCSCVNDRWSSGGNLINLTAAMTLATTLHYNTFELDRDHKAKRESPYNRIKIHSHRRWKMKPKICFSLAFGSGVDIVVRLRW